MLKQKRFFHSFSWFLCTLLLVTLFHTPIAMSQSPSSISQSDVSKKNKIDQKLYKQFNQQEQVTFLVKLNTQVNTKKVSSDAVQKAKKQQKTPYQTKIAKRSSVVSSLRTTSEQTQAPMIDFLKREKKAGKVKNYHSFYVVNAIAVTGSKETMEKLSKFPQVEKVLPNETRKLHAPIKKNKKPHTSQKVTPSSSVEWNIERVGAPALWAQGIDGSGTVVANIDTGVEWDHPSLKEKYRGYNPDQPNQPDHTFNWFDAVNEQAVPYDDLEHGTHTMGTMVGSEPDGSNQIGVAPGAKWIAVKAFSEHGGTDIDLIKAGEWILAPTDKNGNPHPEKAPDVVNNSWGGGPGLDEFYRLIVQNWRSAEIFPEFSAGNDGPDAQTIATPANYPESFATGATDSNDKLASFSSRGSSPYNEIKPEISAPGANIRSAVPGGGYQDGWDGTSMAGPHVSSTVALMKQVNPSLTVDEIEEILLATANPLTDPKYPNSPNNGYGHGLLNATEAVAALQSGMGQVKGVVSTEGEDQEPPTYEHLVPSTAYQNHELPLSIHVKDNISITKVELSYLPANSTEWKTISAKLRDGNHRDANYQAIIPADQIKLPKLSYRWKITDFGGNSVESDLYQLTVKIGETVGYKQDFESYPSGWSSFGRLSSWEWGKPTVGPTAYSGEKVFATNLHGSYNNTENSTLLLPPVQVPNSGNTYLHFKNYYEIEDGFDFGHVVVSTDKQNWTQVATYNGTSTDWLDAEIDLSPYRGQILYIGFTLSSDNLVNLSGWYLDDVSIDATPLPTIKKNTQASAPLHPPNKSEKKKRNDPKKLRPSKIINIQAPYLKEKTRSVQPSVLPLDAQISVLESGRSTKTNPADGSYSLKHAVGNYTLLAEAYGYQSARQTISITKNEVTAANFIMEPTPRGTVSGRVTSQIDGQPIANATLTLVEDAAITPVKTDAEGNFTFTAYEGEYTLQVTAGNYFPQTTSVTISGDGHTTQNFSLKPFLGYPDEIGYDDGSAEEGQFFQNYGDGWGVRMSPKNSQKKAMIQGGLFYFMPGDLPSSGSDSFQVAVFDASGPNGSPGKKVAGPFDAKALRNGEWTYVDLKDKGIVVEGDFYLTYIQKNNFPYVPELGTDLSSLPTGRTWEYRDGDWYQSPYSLGNFMIRAVVDYELDVPEILSPKNKSFTNQSTITMKGKASPSVPVQIQLNGKKITQVTTNKDGTFDASIPLKIGENILTATSLSEVGATDPSQPVTVTLDQTKPQLTIEQPIDDLKTNREAVTVTGKVSDEHLKSVKVNGQVATIHSNGTYSGRTLLNEGENILTVVALDQAGNRIVKRVKVYAKFTAPSIQNLKPDQDLTLKTGQTVKIELNSEEALRGSFKIRTPLINPVKSPNSVTEFPLMEEREGHYVGYWTVPSNLNGIEGAVIEVTIKDTYGNQTQQTASGKLYINTR